MKLLAIMAVILTLQGCAAYTAASTGVFLATDRTITDHVASTVTGADCASLNPFKGLYWCEQPRDPAATYNRTAF